MKYYLKILIYLSLFFPFFTKAQSDTLYLSRQEYAEKLQGFWLAECIANWTGLVTEMDKIGNIGEIQTGEFYTREDWGKPDQPSIFDPEHISPWSKTIDFVFRGPDEIWGADDDTDIEYMYQYLMATQGTPLLSGNQIQEGWLNHIRTEEENYLWVSNQQALDLMQGGILPPETSNPEINPHYDMIDAQLTTEIFGLLAPSRPDIALKMAYLPIRTTARKEAVSISEFYVRMHALAAIEHSGKSMKDAVFTIAAKAREYLPENEYPAKMYDFVKAQYDSGIPWEAARDGIYERYQVNSEDGYDVTSRNLYCNGCFAAGINFAASLVSLFYGEGDLKETLKIGVLCGWDSDNPTATWGGLLGFMLGKSGVESAFGQQFSDRFNIHRTRQNFPNNGIDTFANMAQTGISIVDRVVMELAGGHYNSENDQWAIPIIE